LSHLPLDEISHKIQGNVMALDSAYDSMLEDDVNDAIVSMEGGSRAAAGSVNGTPQRLAAATN
jgi:hypothetical protein